jgi:hypothetical protein
MKKLLLTTLISILVMSACQQKSHEKEHDHDAEAPDVVEASANQELYNEVMKIHDEVMPKLEDIHKKKETLKNKIAATPDMPKEKKQSIDASIARLDSAGESMMVWMRQFNPVPDSAGEEKARVYLEGEMVKVKKVRENILTALEEADKN